MAHPDTVVEDVRSAAVAVIAAMDKFDATRKKFFALGGASFVAPYFLQGDGTTPRTDLDIIADDITGVINSGDAINDLLAAGHRTNLMKATR